MNELPSGDQRIRSFVEDSSTILNPHDEYTRMHAMIIIPTYTTCSKKQVLHAEQCLECWMMMMLL